MATVSVRIDETIIEEARVAADAEARTLQAQLELWIKVGRTAIENPDLPGDFIESLLIAKQEPRDQITPFIPEGRAAE
jgi:hypothetical protein